MYDMKKANQLKLEKLDRIISVRMTDDDYGTLLKISKGKKSNVSDVIRTVANVVIDLATKNN
jgi:hypothetical protein